MDNNKDQKAHSQSEEDMEISDPLEMPPSTSEQVKLPEGESDPLSSNNQDLIEDQDLQKRELTIVDVRSLMNGPGEGTPSPIARPVHAPIPAPAAEPATPKLQTSTLITNVNTGGKSAPFEAKLPGCDPSQAENCDPPSPALAEFDDGRLTVVPRGEAAAPEAPAHMVKVGQCSLCSRSFSKQSSLNRHVREVHMANRRPRRGGPAAAAAAAPAAAPSPGEERRCGLCPKTFSKPMYLKTHLLRSHEGASYEECEVCERVFLSRDAYQRHLASHMKFAVVYPCSRCPETFSTRRDLGAHARTAHAAPRGALPPYCEMCDVHFSHAHGLRSHVGLAHVARRRFPCPVCERVFAGPGPLRKHRVQGHASATAVGCYICLETLASPAELLAHKWDRHRVRPTNGPQLPRSGARDAIVEESITEIRRVKTEEEGL